MMAPNAVGGVSRLERERLTFSLGGSKSASYRPIVLKSRVRFSRQKSTRLSLKSMLCAEDSLRRFDIAACKNGVSISQCAGSHAGATFQQNRPTADARRLAMVKSDMDASPYGCIFATPSEWIAAHPSFPSSFGEPWRRKTIF